MEMDLGFPDHLVGHRRLQLLLLIFTNPCEKTNHSRLTKCKNNQTLFGGNQNDKDKENFHFCYRPCDGILYPVCNEHPRICGNLQ